ncbi:MAG: hypothetical protein E6Q95_06480 [Chitinophagaceae bacterium]|nr:MAG: hypothetical protein E6Q95_06480 [Chitinophagaceae bacterium]
MDCRYMNVFFIIFLILMVSVIRFIIKSNKKSGTIGLRIADEMVEHVLAKNVLYYQKLHQDQQKEFVQRVQYFLKTVTITPISQAPLNNEHRVLIASSGIIPIFYYPHWFYTLDEILVYPEVFNLNFDIDGANRNIGGLVGDGALKGKMILSLSALVSAYHRATNEHTAIHEFAHLIDKSDGKLDGIPELFFDNDNIIKWKNVMNLSMERMANQPAGINLQAMTSPSEFFAIMTEFYFQNPDELKEKWPEVFFILEKAFCNT